jgi:uncharacterized protein (DUF4415 family)
MRKEYKLEQLKVKRRGPLPGLKDAKAALATKVKLTIMLDADIVAHFKQSAAQSGALPYQTQINQALRQMITPHENDVRSALLKDRAFIASLARAVKRAA